MSDDAFALTPAAAQPAQPSEAVYQALNAALSATARGRWFLSEFARRNRNSESSKMLDAVARIEQAVATRPALSAASSDLAIARSWAAAARDEAAVLLTGPEREVAQAAAQRGTRIIREIAYSMRTVGNDPRICNILDAQLDAIEAAQRSALAPSKGVLAALERLVAQLDELVPAQVEVLDVTDEQQVKLLAPADFNAVADLAVACATGDPKVALTPADIAEDEALLDRIAFEMAAAADDDLALAPPDPAPAPPPSAAGTSLPPVAPAKAEIAATPAVVSSAPVSSAAPAKDVAGPSLGEALLAQGLVQQPAKPASDPFGALKRLTQSEKVALFT